MCCTLQAGTIRKAGGRGGGLLSGRRGGMGGDRCQNSRPVLNYWGGGGGGSVVKCCKLLHKTSTISIPYQAPYHWLLLFLNPCLPIS